MRVSVIRARFCELLAQHSPQGHDSQELFLLGLFSLLPAMLDMEMTEILQQLPLSATVADSLLELDSPYSSYLKAVCAYEQGNWDNCCHHLKIIEINQGEISNIYLEAINWSDLIIATG